MTTLLGPSALRLGAAPEPSFEHVRRMSDDTGLFEHASGTMPLREHGYCVDDVSRGLLIVCREPDPSGQLTGLAETYLAFLAHAQGPDGSFHNRMGFDRQWHDTPRLGDWWGRALWGLGTAAVHGPTEGIRTAALERFDAGAGLRTPLVRSMVFAALGAADVLAAWPDHEPARALLADTAELIGGVGKDPEWPWPQNRLTYGNASIAETLIAAGSTLNEVRWLDDGLTLLEWLLNSETHDGHLSLTPVGGWRIGEPRPAFDQQPIEAAAMADACARAYEATKDAKWLHGVELALAWFLGENDSATPLIDERSGGGCDGLKPEGRNGNQGAESTLALVAVLQHGRRLEGLRRHQRGEHRVGRR